MVSVVDVGDGGCVEVLVSLLAYAVGGLVGVRCCWCLCLCLMLVVVAVLMLLFVFVAAGVADVCVCCCCLCDLMVVLVC